MSRIKEKYSPETIVVEGTVVKFSN